MFLCMVDIPQKCAHKISRWFQFWNSHYTSRHWSQNQESETRHLHWKGPCATEIQLLHTAWWSVIAARQMTLLHGPLTMYAKSWVAHAPGMPGTFSPPSIVSDLGMHHGTCVTHVSGLLTRGGRGKRSRHSLRMRNPQFYVFGKRPIDSGPVR